MYSQRILAECGISIRRLHFTVFAAVFHSDWRYVLLLPKYGVGSIQGLAKNISGGSEGGEEQVSDVKINETEDLYDPQNADHG